jgi:P27 family predicted phage terminase small subunit
MKPGQSQRENGARWVPARPKMPKHLDAEARAMWRRVVPELYKAGVLVAIDADELAAMCSAWSAYRTATTTLEKDGRYLVATNGAVYRHPAVADQSRSLSMFLSCARRFGLDPDGRSRLVVPEQPLEDMPNSIINFSREKSA